MNSEHDPHKSNGQKTVFRELLNSNLPPAEKSFQRLNEEAMIIVPAAMERPKTTVAIAVFHLLTNVTMLQRLKEELIVAWPDVNTVPSLPELEKLPYLTAIIQEGIFPTHRIDRIQAKLVQLFV